MHHDTCSFQLPLSTYSCLVSYVTVKLHNNMQNSLNEIQKTDVPINIMIVSCTVSVIQYRTVCRLYYSLQTVLYCCTFGPPFFCFDSRELCQRVAVYNAGCCISAVEDVSISIIAQTTATTANNNNRAERGAWNIMFAPCHLKVECNLVIYSRLKLRG